MPTGTLQCTVWLDRNGDGRVSANENGVPGAIVVVRNETGQQRLTTDAQGVCRLENLADGIYEIEVIASTSPTNGPRVRQFTVSSSVAQVSFGFNSVGVRGIQIGQPATSSQTANLQPNETPDNTVLAFTGARSLVLAAVALMILGLGGLLSTRRRRVNDR